MQLETTIFLFILSMGLTYSLWTIFNSQQAKSSRQQSRKRKSDRVKLSRADKKVYRNAFEQYKKKNFKACAQLLESINYHREAINILEKHNQIHDAANMLMRMQLPNRAGYIYARNGFWKESVECFKLANLPNEVATSAKKAGDLATAVSYFVESENYHEAADVYSELGKHKEAGELYAKINDHKRAIEEYTKLLSINPDLEDLGFSNIELKIISSYLIEGKAKEELADILILEDQLLDTLITIVRQNNIELAGKILKRNTKNIGAEIVELSSLSKEDNEIFAKLLMDIGAYEYSGILFERIEEFEKAGDAFKFDQDYSRASEAYEKAGCKDLSTEMRILFAQNGPKSLPEIPNTNNVHEVQKEKDIEPYSVVVPSPPSGSQNEIELTLNTPDNKPNLVECEQNSSHVAVPPPPTQSSSHVELDLSPGFSIDTPTETKARKKFSEDTDESTSIIKIEDIPDPTAAFKKNVNHNEAHSKLFSGSDNKEFGDLNWSAFHNADFLRDLTSDQTQLLKNIARPYTYKENELILEYGQEPLGIYFILSGKVHIYKNQDQSVFDELGASETFGELWLLIDQPSNVQFVSHEESQILTIKRADFNNLLDNNGTIARLLYKRFTSKLLDKLVNSDNQNTKNIAS